MNRQNCSHNCEHSFAIAVFSVLDLFKIANAHACQVYIHIWGCKFTIMVKCLSCSLLQKNRILVMRLSQTRPFTAGGKSNRFCAHLWMVTLLHTKQLLSTQYQNDKCPQSVTSSCIYTSIINIVAQVKNVPAEKISGKGISSIGQQRAANPFG